MLIGHKSIMSSMPKVKSCSTHFFVSLSDKTKITCLLLLYLWEHFWLNQLLVCISTLNGLIASICNILNFNTRFNTSASSWLTGFNHISYSFEIYVNFVDCVLGMPDHDSPLLLFMHSLAQIQDGRPLSARRLRHLLYVLFHYSEWNSAELN